MDDLAILITSGLIIICLSAGTLLLGLGIGLVYSLAKSTNATTKLFTKPIIIFSLVITILAFIIQSFFYIDSVLQGTVFITYAFLLIIGILIVGSAGYFSLLLGTGIVWLARKATGKKETKKK